MGGWAVVAGATGAIGSAIVTELAGRGMSVVAVARSAEHLAELADRDQNVTAVQADLGHDESITQIEATLSAPVRMVVNAAGAPFGGGILEVPLETVTAATELKVNGTLRLVRATDALLETGSRIVVLGGNLGLDPIPEAATAGIVNAAVANMVRQLSRAYGSRGVTCHLIAPGPVDSPRLRRLAEDAAEMRGVSAETILAEFAESSPLRKLGRPSQVAWAVGLLTEPQAEALAGSTILLDHGRRTGIP